MEKKGKQTINKIIRLISLQWKPMNEVKMLKIKADEANIYKEKLGKLKKYSDICRRLITYIAIVTCTPVTSTTCGLNILL